MRAAPAGGGGGGLLRRLLLLTAAVASAAVPASAHVAGGGQQRAEAAAASASMPTSPARVSLPTLMAGVEGLSPPCQKALLSLEARLAMNDTEAFTTVLEASFASGRVIEGLYVLDQGVKASKLHPPTPEEQKQALLNLVGGYPWVSLGAPDSCGYIPDFQYCHLDVALIYVRYGLCVPAACNAQDIQIGLNATYFRLTQQYLDSTILLADATTCGDTSFPATAGTWVMVALTAVLLLLAAAGSGVDMLRKKEIGRAKRWEGGQEGGNPSSTSPPRPPSNDAGNDSSSKPWYMRKGWPQNVLLCFSVPRNWALLLGKARGGAFDSLDGIRSLSMSWVIFGHTFIFALLQVSFSNAGSEVLGHDGGKGFLASYQGQSVTGGYFAVDTFFFLSAFLAVYFMMEEIGRLQSRKGEAQGGKSFCFKVPMIYVLRFLRLTPTYFYVVLMYWKVLRLADKGPFWTQMLEPDYAGCEANWQYNLLYVNNLIDPVNDIGQPLMCYPVSWYLGVDFQLFIITPLFALLGASKPKATLAFLGLLSLVSILYSWIQAYRLNWTIELLDQSTYFQDYYIKPWTRAPPAFIGMALAIVWYHYYRPVVAISGAGDNAATLPTSSTNNTFRLRRSLVYSLLAAALFLFAITVEGARGAYTDSPPPWSKATMSAYVALSKPAWTVGLALLCFLLFLGEGGPINWLLECRAFTVTSRLTYCAYLIHPAIIFWLYGDHLGPLHYSTIWYIIHFLGFLSAVLILSVVVHLLVERPVANLERLTRSKPKPSGAGAGAGGAAKKKQAAGFAKAEEKFDDGNGITEPLLAATLQEEEGEDQVEGGNWNGGT